MKLWAISLIMTVFLTGCDATSEIERGMALRSALLKAKESSFLAAITADYGETAFTFSMDCRFDDQGNMDFTVTQPQTVADITGSVRKDTGALTFDETVLFIDLLTDDQISPICAPWILMKTLRGGYITSACMEDDLLRLSVDDSYDADALTLDIWINENDLPVRAEILYGGRRILTVEIGSFQIL